MLDGMIKAALSAAEVILDIYATDFDVCVKGDASPVTQADQAAEAVIFDHLTQRFPDIPVIAEEAVSTGRIPEIGRDFFLVDPVDGTKEFISRNGEFTVNIALIRDGLPQIGVVFTPAKGWLFVGDVGRGAWRGHVRDPRQSHAILNKRSIEVRDCRDRVDVVGSRSHLCENTEAYLDQFDIGKHKPVGSSLKFCLLAAGEADLYPRFSRTMEWDTAAGDAVLSAAGGIVETAEGQRLLYGKIVQEDAPFANPAFVARTRTCPLPE
ncbi:3'(2'),5'-bisphosphate nucleotidase CysQ [Cohaesibacter sp. CAU 1516]|nr:3'(2'),5'-bisphosphate nucleotidase CysQ [Cohaesibacter sp. CAU 1516]